MIIDLKSLHNTLTGYQLDILNSKKRYTVTIASTKCGKTYSHLVWLLTLFLDSEKNGNFWWVAPIYSQAKIAYRRIKREMLQYGNNFQFNESELTVRFKSKILSFKSADNPNGLYGDDVYALVFDEFTRSTEEAWHACRSTLTKTEGKAKLIGNYTGETNWGVRLQKEMENNPAWAFFKITAFDAVDAGILNIEEIEQARADLAGAPGMFDALYLATGGYELDKLVNSYAISDLFTNDYVPYGKMSMTADIAFQGSDLFVVMVWSGFRLVKCYTYKSTTSKEVNDILRDIAKIHSVPYSRICYDADGLGSSVTGYITDAIPFNGNKKSIGERRVYSNRKSQIHYLGAQRLNDGGYFVEPTAIDFEMKKRLIEELSSIKREKKDNGLLSVISKEKIKVFLGRSPDLSDAFLMREILDFY